jgi:hypothetical protein
MLLAIAYVAKFVQRQNFEIPPKIEILIFFQNQKFLYVEEALKHVFAIWIFNPIIFHMLFLLSKTAFVCEFQHTPLCKMMFFSRFHTSHGYEILLTCT